MWRLLEGGIELGAVESRDADHAYDAVAPVLRADPLDKIVKTQPAGPPPKGHLQGFP